MRRLGITPTSIDPVVSTIFATHGDELGNGILQIGLPKNFQGVEYTSNVLGPGEREIALGVKPVEFTQKSKCNHYF